MLKDEVTSVAFLKICISPESNTLQRESEAEQPPMHFLSAHWYKQRYLLSAYRNTPLGSVSPAYIIMNMC